MNPIRFIRENKASIFVNVLFFLSWYACGNVVGYRQGYVEGAVDMALGLANTETNIVHSAEVP